MYEEERLEYTKEDVRFGTPEAVAIYRAERLKCSCLIEVGCSVGFQTFPFAANCKHVIAVEIDKRKIEVAKKNAAVLGFKNVDFVLGDALDKDTIAQIKEVIAEKKLKVGSVFLDPERAESEKERAIETLKPDINKFIQEYSEFTNNIAIELPPHIEKKKLEKLPEHELEYISLNNNLNRLTAYFGKLKKAEVSLVILPEGRKMIKAISGRKLIGNLREITDDYKYFYEINPALIAADLLEEALAQNNAQKSNIGSSNAQKTDAAEVKIFEHNKKRYLLSDNLLDEELFTRYGIISVAEIEDDAIKNILDKEKAGKVTLHGSIKQDEYFKLKNKFEKGLRGNKTLHLFLFDKCVVCERV